MIIDAYNVLLEKLNDESPVNTIVEVKEKPLAIAPVVQHSSPVAHHPQPPALIVTSYANEHENSISTSAAVYHSPSRITCSPQRPEKRPRLEQGPEPSGNSPVLHCEVTDVSVKIEHEEDDDDIAVINQIDFSDDHDHKEPKWEHGKFRMEIKLRYTPRESMFGGKSDLAFTLTRWHLSHMLLITAT